MTTLSRRVLMPVTRRLSILALFGLLLVLVTGTTSIPDLFGPPGPDPALAVTPLSSDVELVGLAPPSTTPTTTSDDGGPVASTSGRGGSGGDGGARDVAGRGTGGPARFGAPATAPEQLDDAGGVSAGAFDYVSVNLSRVNPGGVSWFDDLFVLENTGEAAICVWVDDDAADNDAPGAVRWYADGNRDAFLDSEARCVPLAPGESVGVGSVVDATDTGAGTQLLRSLDVRTVEPDLTTSAA